MTPAAPTGRPALRRERTGGIWSSRGGRATAVLVTVVGLSAGLAACSGSPSTPSAAPRAVSDAASSASTSSTTSTTLAPQSCSSRDPFDAEPDDGVAPYPSACARPQPPPPSISPPSSTTSTTTTTAPTTTTSAAS